VVPSRPFVLATLEGYSVEGGYDRANEPTTCFSPTIALGRHPGPGEADGLWSDYEKVLDVAATLGLDGVRFGVEWARIEPHRDHVDDAALARYHEVLHHATSRGLRVSVCTFGASWPAWLGLEAWLLPWVAPLAVAHVRRVVDVLGADINGLVLFDDADSLVRRGYLEGSAPPWRRRASADAQSASEQISAIVDELRRDTSIGPLLVARAHTIGLDAVALEEAKQADLDEVYVRALIKGKGPTSASEGLLVKHDGEWRASPGQEVLQALR
jgi:beta-glucosidase/6-phospho-beta-glucosidase/beta-galactosidase